MRSYSSCQNLSAGAAFDRYILHFLNIKFLAGIHLFISRSQFQTASGNKTEPPPARTGGLKHPFQDPKSGWVSFFFDYPLVLNFYFGFTILKLPQQHNYAFEYIKCLKTGNHTGLKVFLRQYAIWFHPYYD